MKKFTLNLWSNEEKKKQAQAVASGKAESAVIDGVDGQQGGGGGGRFFGIKSYLHHFYLASPTSGNPFVDDVEVPTAVGQGSGTTWFVFTLGPIFDNLNNIILIKFIDYLESHPKMHYYFLDDYIDFSY